MSSVQGFTCGICESRFSLKTNFKRHLNSKHLRRFWNCHVCNKSFNRNDNLRKHARTCLPTKRSRKSDIEFGYSLTSISKLDESQKTFAIGTENSQPSTSSTERSNEPYTIAPFEGNVEWKENNLSQRDPPNGLKLKSYEADSNGQAGELIPNRSDFGHSKSATSTNESGTPRIVYSKPFTKEDRFSSKIDESIANRENYEETTGGAITVRIDGNQSMIPSNTCHAQQTTGAEVSQKYDVPLEGNKRPLDTNVQNVNVLEELHTKLARQAVQQAILKYLPGNIAPVLQDLQAGKSDLCSNSDLDELSASVIGTSPPSKRVGRQGPNSSDDILTEVKIEMLSSDDDCEFVDVQQGAGGVSYRNANKPKHAEQSLLFDILGPKLRDEPQFLVVRMRGEEALSNRSKITKNEIKRKISILHDEHDALLDQEKLNAEKMKILLLRKQQLEANMANVALQKAINNTELNKYTCLLQEQERE